VDRMADRLPYQPLHSPHQSDLFQNRPAPPRPLLE
jgi:hypothetical protein